MSCLKRIGFDLEVFDRGQNELKICLQGTADDEMDLILKSIYNLILQVDLKEMCEEDQTKFDQEMKRILYAVVENYWLNGWPDTAIKERFSNAKFSEVNNEELAASLINYFKEKTCCT